MTRISETCDFVKPRLAWFVGLIALAVEVSTLAVFFNTYFTATLGLIVAWSAAYLLIGSDVRSLALLPFPIIPLLTSSYPELRISSTEGILIYCFAGLSVSGSLEYSRGNIRIWMLGGRRYFRQTLMPSVLLQKAVLRVNAGWRTRLLALLILVLSLGLGLVLPYISAILAPTPNALEIFLLIGFAYLLLVREEIVTATHRNPKVPGPKDTA